MTFLALTNKAGKVTATAEKRAILLNALDSAGVTSIALHGKGAMAKQAAMALGGETLDSLLNSAVALSGAQIATLRAHLVGAWGEASFNRAAMRGLSGMYDYLQAVRLTLLHRVATAETEKAQTSAMARMALCDAQTLQVQALIVLRDAAIVGVPAVTADATDTTSAELSGAPWVAATTTDTASA